jgi:aminoglycoside 6'-N-acetyltransferase I
VTLRWVIREAQATDAPAWIALRAQLWPDESAALLANDANAYFAAHRRAVALLALAGGTQAIGFAEATIRSDYVNGTDSSPVGFLEGWYVAPDWRALGVGRGLVAAVEQWTREHGCLELASDTWLDQVDSQRAHLACGFEETERIVYFRKRLSAAG